MSAELSQKRTTTTTTTTATRRSATMSRFENLEGRVLFSSSGLVAVGAVAGPIYLRDSLGDDATVARLDASGNVVGSPGQVGGEISGLRAEFPNTSAEVWKAPSGKQVQTWTFSASSFDPYEVFQGTGPQVLNGSLTVTGGVQGVETHPDALLDFSPPANAFQASVDVISNTPGTALGFTSSSVLNNNFATSGQIWMVYKNPQGQGQPATWELHTNGTTGPSASGTIIAPGYNHLAISYDPATHRVVGSINGVPTAALSYTPIGIRYVGVEGGTNGRGTVDDFIVQAGAIAPAAPRVGKPGIAPTSDVALSTFSTTSISSDVLGSPSLGTDSLLL